MLTVTDRTGELHYHCQLMRKGCCTVFFTNLNLSTFFHKDSATEIEQQNIYRDSIRVWNQHYPYGLRFLGSWLLTERSIPGGGDPGEPSGICRTTFTNPLHPRTIFLQESYHCHGPPTEDTLPPLKMHFQRSKSTLDSLKTVFNAFHRTVVGCPCQVVQESHEICVYTNDLSK